MEFADYPGLNADLAADFHARHFTRRDTHMFTDHLGQMPHFNPAALAGMAVDVKPRLTKEQHDVLENEFRKQAKPNTNTKKRFAEVLGVSLDKVNNWFQNRRAKSKQDAKKAAGAYNMLQAQQQGQQQQQQSFVGINPMGGMNGMPLDQPFSMPTLYNGVRDNSIIDGPLSSGLGISQPENAFASLDQITSQPMRHQASTQSLASQHSVHSESFADANNRHTLTQAQFDAYSQPSFANMSAADTNTALNSTANGDFYSEFCDFSFDSQSVDPLTSPPMHSNESIDSFAPDVVPDFKPSDNQLRNPSSSSEGSAPSVTISPAEDKNDTFDVNLASEDKPSQSTVTSPQWQPGQSVPVEMDDLRKEFQEAAMRRNFSVQSIPDSDEYLDQPMAFPGDDYNRRESSTVQLARSMQSFTMAPQRSAMPSSSIAARRQRPRPAPLGTTSTRSTSYCGTLPTSPGPVGGNHTIGGHTLRRIKSSQAMNGIAGGRIQKNVGSAQRSPSGYTTFAEANNARYGRRVSSFSPAYASLAASTASLAPPTPLSPTNTISTLRHMQSQPMLRQTSLPEGDENYIVSGMNFSPPTTPLYGGQFIRSRMGSLAVPSDNTPPQSAPPTQQCFPSGAFSPPQMPAMPLVQSQANPQGFLGMLPNEYPQMHNVMFPAQQQQSQYMDTQMSYIMTNTGEVISGYPVMPPFTQGHMQQATPPHQQQPFLPSSSLSPGVLGSSQVPKHVNPGADFFVHEYSPPRDVKQSNTPRKAVESGPKNYTFSNHGPEYFEKHAKQKGSSSPASSSCESAAA
ncbi:hypothetical protein E4T49_03663 [Aureobasidium sp. EXF-10728]|nr:hypothetical protein E4T49_03663 [Aureobasidium sp. EXF-10728]